MKCHWVSERRHQRAQPWAKPLASALGRGLLALLLLGGASASHAAVGTPPPPQCLALARAPEPTTAQGVREQVNQMLAVLAECQNSAELLAALGHVFNLLGEPVEALGHLERAVMLDPTPPGARLDYAMALAKTGEVQAAVTLVDELLQQPDVPPLLLPELQRQRAAWVDGQWAGRSVLSLRAGRDSNLLGSPGLNNLTITLPDLAFQLPLDPSFQNRAGSYALASFQTEWQRVALDGSYWELSGGARRRQSPATPLARTEQLDLAVERAINFVTESACSPTAGGARRLQWPVCVCGFVQLQHRHQRALPPAGRWLGLAVPGPGPLPTAPGGGAATTQLISTAHCWMGATKGWWATGCVSGPVGCNGSWACAGGWTVPASQTGPAVTSASAACGVWPTCPCVRGSSHKSPQKHGPRAPCWWTSTKPG